MNENSYRRPKRGVVLDRDNALVTLFKKVYSSEDYKSFKPGYMGINVRW